MSRMPQIDRHFSVGSLAERLELSRRTIERAVAAGSFPRAVFLGRTWRIPAGDVEQWLQGRRPFSRRFSGGGDK